MFSDPTNNPAPSDDRPDEETTGGQDERLDADDSLDNVSRQWVQKAKDGGGDSVWNLITDRYQNAVYMCAELNLGPALRARGYIAEDLVQEAWLQFIQSLETFEPQGRGAVRRWLCTKIRRLAIDWARKGGERGAERDRRSLDVDTLDLPNDDESLSSAVANRDALEQLAESLRTGGMLSAYRMVLTEVLIEGRDRAEVAEESGLKPDTLRKKLNRGRQIWRDQCGLDAGSYLPDAD